MRHERQRRDARRQFLAVDAEQHGGAGRGEAPLDVTHGDRTPAGRGEAARGHLAADRAVGPDDIRALLKRLLALWLQSDAQPPRPIGDLVAHALRAGKGALLATPARDRPGEPRLHRRRRLVDVVAPAAKPGFETQRLTCAHASELHLRFAQQALDDGRDPGRPGGYFKPILAGVAGTADVALDTVETGADRGHEA